MTCSYPGPHQAESSGFSRSTKTTNRFQNPLPISLRPESIFDLSIQLSSDVGQRCRPVLLQACVFMINEQCRGTMHNARSTASSTCQKGTPFQGEKPPFTGGSTSSHRQRWCCCRSQQRGNFSTSSVTSSAKQNDILPGALARVMMGLREEFFPG